MDHDHDMYRKDSWVKHVAKYYSDTKWKHLQNTDINSCIEKYFYRDAFYEYMEDSYNTTGSIGSTESYGDQFNCTNDFTYMT